MAKDFVGEGEDLRRRTIIRIDGMNQRPRVTGREGHDVFPVGPAPGVDTLRIVADGHDLVVRTEEVDDAALQSVSVLKLVNQEVLEAAAVVFQRGGVALEHAQPEHEQIIEVTDVTFFLRSLVGVAETDELFGPALHPVQTFADDLSHGSERIPGMGVGVEDDPGLGVGLIFDESPVGGLDDFGEKVFRLFLVEDGEVGRTACRQSVAAQDALADGVEGAAPELPTRDAGEVLDAFEHLLGRLVGERQ